MKRVNRHASHRIARRRGSTTLEFAVLLPLLTTIGLLCVDYGRFCHSYVAITNASRAGAAFGSLRPPTANTTTIYNAAVRQAVIDELQANGWFQVGDLTVNNPVITNEGGGDRRVSVTVSYPFRTLINWPFLPGYNDPVMLRHTAVMRIIR